jgi:HAD superfamily hydrolase (TIGR01509 family)
VLVELGLQPTDSYITYLLHKYGWRPVEGVEPFPDTLTALPLLLKEGYKLGLVSNSSEPMWMRDIELDAFGVLTFFPSCRISSADVGFLKPHPAIFHAALECLGVTTSETIFVGDRIETDIVGAHALGMNALLRLNAHNPTLLGQCHKYQHPYVVIKDLNDLMVELNKRKEAH